MLEKFKNNTVLLSGYIGNSLNVSAGTQFGPVSRVVNNKVHKVTSIASNQALKKFTEDTWNILFLFEYEKGMYKCLFDYYSIWQCTYTIIERSFLTKSSYGTRPSSNCSNCELAALLPNLDRIYSALGLAQQVGGSKRLRCPLLPRGLWRRVLDIWCCRYLSLFGSSIDQRHFPELHDSAVHVRYLPVPE